ncbi:hypothetical protein JTB14_012412 [Gonioctena quinquepunctata]|nr:hypothetical protein JTB14_012412 [Gonioctena quinquepunctata]
MKNLEEENYILKNKVESLDKESRGNNIIIFTSKEPNNENTAEFLCGELNKLVTVNISEGDLKNVYCLGKGPNSPIKVEFLTFITKKSFNSKSKKLKGTGIAIANDLTQ